MTRRVLPLLALAAIAAVLFSQLRGLPPPAAIWLLVLLLLLPLLTVVQVRAVSEHAASLPRGAIYRDSALSLWALALATAAIAWWSGMPAASLGLARLPLLPLLAWSIGLTAAGLLVMLVARIAGMREAPLLEHLIPRTRREKAGFAALSVTAGVCEEFIFRGFMIRALYTATGALPLAVIVAAGAFGVVHAYQQPAGAARAAALGALLALPFLATGSIVPAVIAHAAIDLIAGLLLRERLLR